MSSKLWKLAGRTIFWLSWPALWVYLRGSQRTRVLVISPEDEILVVKAWYAGNDKWMLPGGGLHRQEEPLLGALRELQEETGLELLPTQLRSIGSANHKSKGFKVRLQFYVAELSVKEPLTRQRGEISQAAWVAANSLTEANAEADVLLALARWPRATDFATM